MVQRLAKGVLPANTQIQKDAILAMQKGATVFVNYLAQAYVRTLLGESLKDEHSTIFSISLLPCSSFAHPFGTTSLFAD